MTISISQAVHSLARELYIDPNVYMYMHVHSLGSCTCSSLIYMYTCIYMHVHSLGSCTSRKVSCN